MIQFDAPNAFRPFELNEQLTIDGTYVRGVVLSRMNALGNCNRAWTFAAALNAVPGSDGIHAWPYTHNKPAMPWRVHNFIGEDYFCETGTVDKFQYGCFYVDDFLWDRNECGPISTCCN